MVKVKAVVEFSFDQVVRFVSSFFDLWYLLGPGLVVLCSLTPTGTKLKSGHSESKTFSAPKDTVTVSKTEPWRKREKHKRQKGNGSTMPQPSDSNYAAATRHRRPFSTAGRPPVLDIVDDEWASARLPDDDVSVAKYEAAVAPLLEEGELDSDAIVVSPTGNSSTVASNAERRRREDLGWNDLGLDQLSAERALPAASASSTAQQQPNNQATTQQ
jgi:hypothetical protein